MRIFISTGIYPPELGGPAQYAKNLEETWKKQGHKVSVGVFSRFNFLPTGLRHLVFMLAILPKVFRADFILILDTFSAALPTVFLGKFFGKKMILRTGGDFLWEQYVERTGDKVLFKDFYETKQNNFSDKEKKIFKLTKYVLKNISVVVWSTEWQKQVFMRPYSLEEQNHVVIENYYGSKEGDVDPNIEPRIFMAGGRDIKLKNLPLLKDVFQSIKTKTQVEMELSTSPLDFPTFMQKIKNCYAVMVVSISEISPNMILDAIRLNRPFICTKEVGILPRIKDVGIFVDPLNKAEIEEAILKLLDKDEYEKAREKVRNFSFVHTWEQIAEEFLGAYNSIK